MGGDEGEDVLAALGDGEAGEGVGFGEGADVGTGGESSITGAGEDEDAEGGVGGEGGEDEFEFVEHLGVEGVEDLGAMEGEGGDGAILFEVQRFEVVELGGVAVEVGDGGHGGGDSRVGLGEQRGQSKVGTGANANR